MLSSLNFSFGDKDFAIKIVLGVGFGFIDTAVYVD